MSATTTEILRVPGTEVIQLLPEDIYVNPELTVRPGEDETEDTALETLAASIKAVGQLQNAVVVEVPVENSDGPGGEPGVEYHLVAGHRRLAAIQLLNASLPEGSKKKYYLNCSVTRDQSESLNFQKALAENFHRKATTPIQLAMNIARVRAENSWEGGKNTAKVAKYFGASPAQITQHEKLLTLDEDLQAKINSGELTAQQGFILVGVAPEKREKVLLKALELSGYDTTMADAEAPGGQGEAEEGEAEGGEAPGEETAKKTGKKGKIKTEALAQAVREEADPDEKPVSRSRKELVAWFDMFDSPVYHDNVRRFVREFIDNYATGIAVTDRKLKRLFDTATLQISDEELDVLPAKAESKSTGKGKGKKTDASA